MAVHGEQERISVRVFTLTAEKGSPPLTLYLRDIAPVGVGLAMEGAERPPPLSLVCHCDTVLTSGNTPAARPLPRPPPAPSRGGGQCVAIVRMVVHGEETGLSGNFLA